MCESLNLLESVKQKDQRLLVFLFHDIQKKSKLLEPTNYLIFPTIQNKSIFSYLQHHIR